MNREVHVRFCEGLGVKFPRATRLWYGPVKMDSWFSGKIGQFFREEKFFIFHLTYLQFGDFAYRLNKSQAHLFIFQEDVRIWQA